MEMTEKNLISFGFLLLAFGGMANNLGIGLHADSVQFALTILSILLSLSAIVLFYKVVPANRRPRLLVALAVAVIACTGFILALYSWSLHVATSVHFDLAILSILLSVLAVVVLYARELSFSLLVVLAVAVAFPAMLLVLAPSR
jgi:hypothetical protein